MTHPDLASWIHELRSFPTLAELHRSEFFRRKGPAIQHYLSTPEQHSFPGTSAHLKQFLRAISWNIEKGVHWREITETLRVDPYLRAADLIFLNEVDVGMARSGNVHVARELAHSLKMNYVFAPAHLELTKGLGRDLEAAGENEVGIQGNAILSRYPIREAQIIELPECHDFFNFKEKRFGRRIALRATVYTDQGSLWAVCTHLEVRNSPACRARQMRTILGSIGAEEEARAVLLGGDWNTNSFIRGSRWRALRAYLRIGLTKPDRLVEQLKYPDHGGEKLFGILKRSGFVWEDFNDRQETCSVELPAIEDISLLPGFLHGVAQRRLELLDHQLKFRLDWFAAIGLRALRKNEETDVPSGVKSVGAVTRAEVNDRPLPLSDHHPILVDIHLPPEEATQIRAAA